MIRFHYFINCFFNAGQHSPALSLVAAFLYCLPIQAQTSTINSDSLWNEVGMRLNEGYDYVGAISALELLKKHYDRPEKIEDQLACTLYQALCNLELKQWDNLKYSLDDFKLNSFRLPDSLSNSIYFADHHYLLGIYYYQKGKYLDAARYYKSTLQKIQNRTDEFSYSIQDVYNNLGTIYKRIGDTEQALIYLKFSESPNDNGASKAKKKCNLALAYINQKNFSPALQCLEEVAEILESTKRNENYEKLNNSFNLIYGKLQNRLANAGEALNSLLTVDEKLLDPSQRLTLRLEKSLSQYRLGNIAQMEQELNAGVTMSKSELISRHPNLASLYDELANFALQRNEAQRALNFINESLELLVGGVDAETAIREVQAMPIYFQSLRTKAKILDKLGDDEEALGALTQAGDLIEYAILQGVTSTNSKYYWIDKAKYLFEDIIERLIKMNRLDDAWKYIQSGKGILLTQALNQMLLAENDPNLKLLTSRSRDLRMDINFLESHVSGEENKAAEQLRLENLISANEQKDSLDQIVNDEYPGYQNWFDKRRMLTVSEARKRLASGQSMLLDMFVGQNNIYLFRLTKNEKTIGSIPNTPELQEQLQQFLELINTLDLSADNFQRYIQLGTSIYNALFRKLFKLDNGGILDLTFVPDEEYNYLPLGALLTQSYQPTDTLEVRYDQLSYLAQKVDVSYEYATELFGSKKTNYNSNQLKGVVGFAPVFKGRSTNDRNLDSLLYNMSEVQIINKIVGGKINLAETATKANFKNDIQEYRIAHLATHASCNDSLPFNSHIRFYQDSLRLFEILNLPNKLELIVLSACDTGSGELKKGEGISSLARGFINSGCPSIVTTLWQVNDKQTANLMQSFYTNLQQGKNKKQSLGEAQRAYLESTMAASLAHPYYWAAFIQIGNADSIQFNNSFGATKFFVLAGLLSLIVIGYFVLKKR